MCKQSELRSNVPWWTLIQDVQKGEHHDEEDLVVVVVVVAAETAGVALLVVVVYCGVLGGWRILEFFWYLCFLHMAYNHTMFLAYEGFLCDLTNHPSSNRGWPSVSGAAFTWLVAKELPDNVRWKIRRSKRLTTSRSNKPWWMLGKNNPDKIGRNNMKQCRVD